MSEAQVDAYIAYAREDQAFVERLVAALERHDLKIFYDGLLRAGDDWTEELPRRLQAAGSLIVVVTPSALESEYIFREIDFARYRQLRIIPVLQGSLHESNVPAPLADIQWVDFRDDKDFDGALERLIQGIKAGSPFQRWEGHESIPGDLMGETHAENSSVVIAIHLSTGAILPLQCDAELAMVLARAAHFGTSVRSHAQLSFTSLLLGLLVRENTLSGWLRRYGEDGGLLEALLRKAGIDDEAAFDEVAQQPVESEVPSNGYMVTHSVGELFARAQGLCSATQPESPKGPLGVRHLIGAFIYSGTQFHSTDWEALKIDRSVWSLAFLHQMEMRYPDEMGAWREAHKESFAEDPQLASGPSTHIATDVWTTEDSLGYGSYAHAISRFLLHEQTRPPLTISIQAPWGGGKTSLMRMIQQEVDPDAYEVVQEEAKQSRGRLTVENVLDEIQAWVSSDRPDREDLPKLKTADRGGPRRLSVWFNAWKYESLNQVWAGLADAIMQQIAARLSPLDRERFWLRLNLKRIDADKIRLNIHDKVFAHFWRKIRLWSVALGAVIASSFATVVTGAVMTVPWSRFAEFGGGAVFVGAIVTAGVQGFKKYRDAQEEVNEEPAAVSLGDILTIPTYQQEVGFVHQVEVDLRRVFDTVPEKYLPLVVFIDDLDRCSPTKVAQVVEAINLFLAGDFPQCFFVIGMDTEMVAAALQAAHKDMISCLPSDAGSPVGWRFMDKFVQLPFLIPPAESPDVKRYTKVLFSVPQDSGENIEVEAHGDSSIRKSTVTGQMSEDKPGSEKGDKTAKAAIEQRVDEEIARFDDRDPELRRVMESAAPYFKNNPRELKRFANVFRLHYYLWAVRRARGLEVPTRTLMVRWTIFSMRWPEVVRWLRRGSVWGQPEPEVGGATEEEARLDFLEGVDELKGTNGERQQVLAERLGIDTDSLPKWCGDRELFRFLSKKEDGHGESLRLSAGAGKGLW